MVGATERGASRHGNDRISADRRPARDGLGRAQRREVLKSAIPGCQELTGSPEQGFEAKVKQKVGPVSATFIGRGYALRRGAARSYTISGEGKGGAAGFAKGSAAVRLDDKRRRHAPHLRREGGGRRQDRAARLAADRRRGEEHGRQVLRQLPRGARARGRARPTRRRCPRARSPAGSDGSSAARRERGHGAWQRRARPLEPGAWSRPRSSLPIRRSAATSPCSWRRRWCSARSFR